MDMNPEEKAQLRPLLFQGCLKQTDALLGLNRYEDAARAAQQAKAITDGQKGPWEYERGRRPGPLRRRRPGQFKGSGVKTPRNSCRRTATQAMAWLQKATENGSRSVAASKRRTTSRHCANATIFASWSKRSKPRRRP